MKAKRLTKEQAERARRVILKTHEYSMQFRTWLESMPRTEAEPVYAELTCNLYLKVTDWIRILNLARKQKTLVADAGIDDAARDLILKGLDNCEDDAG